MRREQETNIWTNLLVERAVGLLFVGGSRRSDPSPFRQENGMLKISLDRGTKCPIIIPGGATFCFAEGSIFEGHDVGRNSVSNVSEADVALGYNEAGQGLFLQPVGESADYSICLVNAWSC